MLITKKWLADRDACREGLKWFISTYPKGLDTESDEQLARWEADEDNWLTDLIITLAWRTPSFYVWLEEHNNTEIVCQLREYLKCNLEDLPFRLQDLPIERKRKCLQQVARMW